MTKEGSEPFDASKYLVKLRGKEYLEVKWRMVWVRKEHPDAVIETEMVSHLLDVPMAVFKAKVSIPGGGSATGWGQEEAADFGDYLEKAETKALGRALAALGFGTQFTEDFDFHTDENGKVVDTPVQRGPASGRQLANEAKAEVRAAPPRPQVQDGGPPANVAPHPGSKPGGQTHGIPNPKLAITEKQAAMIYGLGAEMGWDAAKVDQTALNHYGKEEVNRLNRAEASGFIEKMTAHRDKLREDGKLPKGKPAAGRVVKPS